MNSSLGDTKGERAMASCTGEKGDRAAVVSETPHSSKEKLPQSLEEDLLDSNLDILFVGYRTESSLTPILNALAQSNVVFPKLTVADGARGALENRIGFLHVANELGDSAQVKLSIGNVVQKLILFKPKLVCFSGSTIWRTFVNSFAPELDVNDVFYGLQNISHPMLEEKIRSFFYVLPSQLQASQAATLFAEIRIIKEKLARSHLTGERMSLMDLRQELFEKPRTSLLMPTTPLTQTTTTIVNEKKSKKRPPADQDYNRVKIARTEAVQQPTNTIQHRLSGGGIADDLLKDPSENERMTRVRKWVEEQDFDNASPEPNIDQLRPGVLPPHDLYKAATSQSALLTTPAWATAALNAAGTLTSPGLERFITDPNYLNALSHLMPGSFPAVPIAGLGGSQLSNAAWPYGTGVSSLYLRPPTLPAGPVSIPDWEKMMGSGSQADLLQQGENSRVIPAFGIGLIQAQPSAFLLPSQTPMIYPPGFAPQEKDSK